MKKIKKIKKIRLIRARLTSLPYEILWEIMSYFSQPKTVGSMILCCKRFHVFFFSTKTVYNRCDNVLFFIKAFRPEKKLPFIIRVKFDKAVKDSYFAKVMENIENVSLVDISGVGLESSSFKYLKRIHTLDMSRCNQETITDKAFKHLKGIHTLGMSWCDQETITDEAFKYLKGISEEYGFSVEQLKPVIFQKSYVSSSVIRQNLEKGKVETANILLGYNITVNKIFIILKTRKNIPISSCETVRASIM